MSQVATTSITVVFSARRKKCVVHFGLDHVWQDNKERRPSIAAVKLVLRIIERLIATKAVINVHCIILIQRRYPRQFGTVLLHHIVLYVSQQSAPLCWRAGDLKRSSAAATRVVPQAEAARAVIEKVQIFITNFVSIRVIVKSALCLWDKI